MSATYLVVWRPDRCAPTDDRYTTVLRKVLQRHSPVMHCSESDAFDWSQGAEIAGDLHDPETGRYAGSVSPVGIVLRSTP